MRWPPRGAYPPPLTNAGLVGSTSFGTGVPSSGTTLNYGTVTELISAANNTRPSWGVEICVWNTGLSTAAGEATIDILIGGATDEVLIKGLICGSVFAAGYTRYFFPVHVPGGVRVAARLASVRTSITPRVLIYMYGGESPFPMAGRVTTYGTQINNARGQSVSPTASGGTSSVTEMTASTDIDHFYVCPGFQVSTDTTMAERTYNIGVAVGAATEQRLGTWWYQASSTEQIAGSFPELQGFCNVPAGSRLTLLASNSGTNDAAYDGLIYAC